MPRGDGDIIGGRYRVEAVLGQGGFGVTYRAVDRDTDTPVAIKELEFGRADSWKTVELFRREARVLASLDHPSIPKYLDHFDEDGGARMYLVQELAEGRTLAALIEDGWRVDEEGVRDLARRVLAVLVYLHGLDPPVVHRDIKPSNLIRADDGRLFLVDFGSVRDKVRSAQSMASSIVGTFGYMAPEQFQGRASFASDLYGLGATLIHVLSHRAPSELPYTKLKMRFRDVVDVSDELADWLDVLIEPAEEDRFRSADAALRALANERALAVAPVYAIAQRPDGSKVTLKSSGRKFSVAVPGHFSAGVAGRLGFSAFWLSFIAFWTWGASRGGGFFAMFSIPFWIVGLVLVASTVYDLLGVSRLDIDGDTFTFSKTVLGFGTTRDGHTSHLIDATTDQAKVQFKGKGQPDGQEIVVRDGVRELRLGRGLTDVERRWIVDALNAFLARR